MTTTQEPKDKSCPPDISYNHARMIAATYRLGQSLLRQTLKDSEIPVAKADFIRVVSHCPGITQSELADLMLVSKPSVAQAVKELERKGYLYRKTDEADRRVRHLYPTEKSEQAMSLLDAAFERLIVLHCKVLSEKENAAFSVLLEKSAAALREALGDEERGRR